MTKVLILGVNGFIGHHLSARILKDPDWQVFGMDMNADRLEPGERCASTSNRNFEGRQGSGGRTHLVSPAMAAAAAIEGHFVDVRRLS